MVIAEFVVGDGLLLIRKSLCADDIFHPPLVAGCCRKHAAHQMIGAVGMIKQMDRGIVVLLEGPARDEYGSAGT